MIERDLPCREPFDGEALVEFLRTRAVAGVESVDGSTYRRSLSLEHGGGEIELTPRPGAVRCVLLLDDGRDRDAALASCRRLLDMDADPDAIVDRLGQDPVIGALVRLRPGLRVPRCVDGFELAVRAIVGQQVTVAAARTILGRLAARYGEPLAAVSGDSPVRGSLATGEPLAGGSGDSPVRGSPPPGESPSRAGRAHLAYRFPTPAVLAEVDPAELPFPRGRGVALRTLAAHVCAGDLELGADADPQSARAALLEIPGVGPWTASYVSMRALMDSDAWLNGDIGIRNALDLLGAPSDARAASALAERWRPLRSYAVMHLWSSLIRTAAARRT